eukprot:4823554-Alexandrium_andersonii.AAC.1
MIAGRAAIAKTGKVKAFPARAAAMPQSVLNAARHKNSRRAASGEGSTAFAPSRSYSKAPANACCAYPWALRLRAL